VRILVAALALWLLPVAPAAAAACTVSEYRLASASMGNPAYRLQVCGREVKLSRGDLVFFDGRVNDEGPFLEGSIPNEDRCSTGPLPAASQELPDWLRGPPAELRISVSQPIFDDACQKSGESEVVYRFLAADAASTGPAPDDASTAPAADAGEAGQCWLVVYGTFKRADYDAAKALVARIGEGVSVADTDNIRSLPKGRFAVVEGPLSEADADAAQENTRPVAPNSVIVAANDCDGVAPGPKVADVPMEPASGDDAPEEPAPADALPPADPGEPTIINLHAAVTPVGKWPEGIAFDGSDIWVAVSGSRQIVRVDAGEFGVNARVNVGRLPVGMLATADGRILSLVETDRKIWQQSPGGGRSGNLAIIGDCPQAFAGDGRFVWVATYVGCTSAASKVFQIDARTGRTVRSFDLDANLFDIAVGKGGVFTVHALEDESVVRIIDPASGEVGQLELAGQRLLKIAANDSGVFAGGIMNDAGIVDSLAEPIGQAPVPQPVMALDVDDDGTVVAAGEAGAIYVLANSEGSLHLLFTIETDFGQFRPQAVLIAGDRLYLTTHGEGDNGSLLMIDGWRDTLGGTGD